MANSSPCFTSIHSCGSPLKQGTVFGLPAQKLQNIRNKSFKVCIINLQLLDAFGKPKIHKRQLIRAKAAENSQGTKPRSIVCGDCEGNGAIQCTQCKGSGVNSVDHFNGQFKAGELCWLCRGKRDILCGNCNGAGFMGGFMSTQDE